MLPEQHVVNGRDGVMKKLLLAVDGSEHSDRAADLAGKLSKGFGAKVDVLNVVSGSGLVSPGMHPYVSGYTQLEDVGTARQALLESAGATLVTTAARRVETAGGTVHNEEVIVGDPADEIANLARRANSDCIVMGRRGLGDIRGLLLGSVSHRVSQMVDKTLITTG